MIQEPEEASTILRSKKNKIDEMRELQIKLYQGGDGEDTLTIKKGP